MIILKIIKGFFSSTFGFIFGLGIFAMIVAMTTAKSMGIIKNIVWPFYSGTLPDLGSFIFMIMSIISFIWLMHKKFVHKRPVLTSMAIGLTIAGVMGFMTPFINVGTYAGDRIGLAFNIDAAKINAGTHAVKGITGYDPRDAVKYFDQVDESKIKEYDLPYAAFAYEVSIVDGHEEKSKRLWLRYRSFLEERFDENELTVDEQYEEGYMRSVNGYYASYFKTLFINDDDIMKKRELLVIAHLTKLGINKTEDRELSDKMYDYLAADKVHVATKIKNKTFNPDEDIREILNYIVLN